MMEWHLWCHQTKTATTDFQRILDVYWYSYVLNDTFELDEGYFTTEDPTSEEVPLKRGIEPAQIEGAVRGREWAHGKPQDYLDETFHKFNRMYFGDRMFDRIL